MELLVPVAAHAWGICVGIRLRQVEETFDGFAFQPEFAPFVDEATGLDDAAAGRDAEVVCLPPDTADRHDGVKSLVVQKAKRSAELSGAAESFAPLQELFHGAVGPRQGAECRCGMESLK